MWVICNLYIPHFTFSELCAKVQSLIRFAKWPQYFPSLGAGQDLSLDTLFINILEFLQDIDWDKLFLSINKSIPEKASEEETAILEFANCIRLLLMNMASKDDPLNKYVNACDIRSACALQTQLKECRKDYDNICKLRETYQRIRSAREQALIEIRDYLFQLLKRLPGNNTISWEQRTAERLGKEFGEYLDAVDYFEPDLLRCFWETVQRFQYGKAYYQLVCESFQEQYRNKPRHQKGQLLWQLSLLDTINQQPQEARTRMPGKSSDGLKAPNFGYRMESSESYQAWLKQYPLAKACGDIILDAFHEVVDFGASLNIPEFLECLRLKLVCKVPTCDKMIEKYIHPLLLHLLEHEFNKPFFPNKKNTVSDTFKSVAGSEEAIETLVSKTLTDFKDMASNIKTLTDFKGLHPFVFGIGFNGNLFGCNAFHTKLKKNEIWLTFSKSRRNNVGHLILSFVCVVARCTEQLSKSHMDLGSSFTQYECLIQRQLSIRTTIDEEIVLYYSAEMLHEHKILVKFMSQLGKGLPFDSLTPELQRWIQNISHWYYIPGDIKLHIARDVPTEEFADKARNLLYDAMIGCSFSEEYPELIPILFLHWKKKLVESTDGDLKKKINVAKQLTDIPDMSQTNVKVLLDQFVTQVHPDLKNTCHFNAFKKKLEEFMNTKLNTELKETEKEIKKLEKIQKHKLRPDTHERLKKYLKRKQQLVNEMGNLSAANFPFHQYEKFKKKIFEQRSLSQCVESLLCRVLGHDRFFPVYISNEPSKSEIKINGTRLKLGNRKPNDVISPCDHMCQLHSLGQLYTGEMLGSQSADHLDHMRRTHGLGGVPNRIQDTFTCIIL